MVKQVESFSSLELLTFLSLWIWDTKREWDQRHALPSLVTTTARLQCDQRHTVTSCSLWVALPSRRLRCIFGETSGARQLALSFSWPSLTMMSFTCGRLSHGERCLFLPLLCSICSVISFYSLHFVSAFEMGHDFEVFIRICNLVIMATLYFFPLICSF